MPKRKKWVGKQPKRGPESSETNGTSLHVQTTHTAQFRNRLGRIVKMNSPVFYYPRHGDTEYESEKYELSYYFDKEGYADIDLAGLTLSRIVIDNIETLLHESDGSFMVEVAKQALAEKKAFTRKFVEHLWLSLLPKSKIICDIEGDNMVFTVTIGSTVVVARQPISEAYPDSF